MVTQDGAKLRFSIGQILIFFGVVLGHTAAIAGSMYAYAQAMDKRVTVLELRCDRHSEILASHDDFGKQCTDLRVTLGRIEERVKAIQKEMP